MIDLVPYVELNGQRTLTDSFIKAFWDAICKDKSEDSLFASKEVTTSEQFISYLKQPANLPVFCFYEGQASGVCWLNNIRKNAAMIHFCFLSNVWGKKALECAEKILAHWFSFPDNKGGYLFDVLIGNTPANNKLASRFAENVGFTILGTVPKVEAHGIVVSYIERDKFNGR